MNDLQVYNSKNQVYMIHLQNFDAKHFPAPNTAFTFAQAPALTQFKIDIYDNSAIKNSDILLAQLVYRPSLINLEHYSLTQSETTVVRLNFKPVVDLTAMAAGTTRVYILEANPYPFWTDSQ